MTEEKQWQNHKNERRENTVFLKHLTISTIKKVSATIQVYVLSNMPLVWHTEHNFGGSPTEHLVKIDKMVSEICVILKKTSVRGWGWPRASTLGAFNLSIHPDHKYIWIKGGDLNH